MFLFKIFPFFLGACAVLQGSLNRNSGQILGMSKAILINALVLLFLASSIFLLGKWKPEALPALFRTDALTNNSLPWWFFLPGIFGFILVAGAPFSISKIGAVSTFVTMVAGQMVTSLLWDQFVTGRSADLYRICGALLTILGAFLTTLSNGQK